MGLFIKIRTLVRRRLSVDASLKAGAGIDQVAPIVTRAPKAKVGAMGSTGSTHAIALHERRNARRLRDFSERNVWVRTAINHRKRALTKAKWSIVRIDDRKAKPDDAVVKTATALFNYVNDTDTNLSTLIAELVEDILVLDAGCLEKEFQGGGQIHALWTIPGEEILPDPKWDGSDPKAPRYYQMRGGRIVAAYLSSELIYMMQNPRTNSKIGFSPLEALIESVEAELYGSSMEYRLMKETAPAGLLYLGGGVPADKVEAFRDQWENDIAGQRGIAFLGGGDDMMMDGKSAPPVFIPFKATASEDDRRAYMKWLVIKIAAAFEIDLLVFNLSETVNKSVGTNMTDKTDVGLESLADTVAMYLTRQVMKVIDPSGRHGFEFQEITRRETAAKIAREQALMRMGGLTPNEVRIAHDLDPYPGSVSNPGHWANKPYPFAS